MNQQQIDECFLAQDLELLAEEYAENGDMHQAEKYQKRADRIRATLPQLVES